MELDNEKVPFGQKLLDKPLVLLSAGLVVMFVFFTIWGVIEIFNLPEATLP